MISGEMGGGWTAILERIKSILSFFLEIASEVLKIGLARLWGPILTVIEFVAELFDIWSDPNLDLDQKSAKTLISTIATLIVIGLCALAWYGGPWVGIIGWFLIPWIIEQLKEWVYKELELSSIRS